MSYLDLLNIMLGLILVLSHSTQLKLYDFMNIRCRDNFDVPLDWWYIYKPPRDTGPYFESGDNFTYITPNSEGRWKPSHKLINSDSMLYYTLSPVYEGVLKKYLAMMSYGARHNFQDDDLLNQKSTAFGVMLANSYGGIWIGHTVPGFPNLTSKSEIFPYQELNRGHMLMCLTLDLPTLNAFTAVVRHTEPNILKFTLPENLIVALSEWTLIETGDSLDEMKETKTNLLNFETRARSVQGFMLARTPEDSRCLYKKFAKLQGIVMDVYSNDSYKQNQVCEEAYSLRHINSISLKFPEQQVYYIYNKTDRSSFGVSTAAAWQRRGQNLNQYWTCVGNVYDQSPFPAKGGLIACVDNYLTWIAFDHLKVKEPTC